MPWTWPKRCPEPHPQPPPQPLHSHTLYHCTPQPHSVLLHATATLCTIARLTPFTFSAPHDSRQERAIVEAPAPRHSLTVHNEKGDQDAAASHRAYKEGPGRMRPGGSNQSPPPKRAELSRLTGDDNGDGPALWSPRLPPPSSRVSIPDERAPNHVPTLPPPPVLPMLAIGMPPQPEAQVQSVWSPRLPAPSGKPAQSAADDPQWSPRLPPPSAPPGGGPPAGVPKLMSVSSSFEPPKWSPRLPAPSTPPAGGAAGLVPTASNSDSAQWSPRLPKPEGRVPALVPALATGSRSNAQDPPQWSPRLPAPPPGGAVLNGASPPKLLGMVGQHLGTDDSPQWSPRLPAPPGSDMPAPSPMGARSASGGSGGGGLCTTYADSTVSRSARSPTLKLDTPPQQLNADGRDHEPRLSRVGGDERAPETDWSHTGGERQ